MVGLEMFIKDLAHTGVSRGLLEAAFQHILRTYRPAKNAHKVSAPEKTRKVKAGDAPKEAQAAKVAVESPKEAAKLSGLNKIQAHQYQSFKAYTASSNKTAREQPEKTWAEEISKLEQAGGTRKDAIVNLIEIAGLDTAEVQASRAYFPKYVVPQAKPGNGVRAAQ
jgi:hypothetical protein